MSAITDFELPATGGLRFASTAFRGHCFVLYFYPKDDTPGCTVEGSDFNALLPDFRAARTMVFGISRDSVASHEKFKAKLGYAFDLLSDADGAVCHQFGVIKEKNMYGRKVLGIERSTFVIGPHGTILREWRAVKVPGHAAQVLAFVRSLAA
jgi:peroxiredoxin Q/BCP